MPGSSHTYIQQNEQYITAHITRKDIIKRIHILFITIMTKGLIQSMRNRKTYTKSLESWAPQGRRLGDERLEVLVLLEAPGELPRVGRN